MRTRLLNIAVAATLLGARLDAQSAVYETRDPRQQQDPEFAKAYAQWTTEPRYGSPLVDHLPSYEDMLPVARQRMLELGLAKPGDRVVVTAGVPFDRPGTTNLLKVENV